MSDGTGASSPPYAFGYDAPEITNVSPSSAATRGGSTITINGLNFGPNGVAREVKVGDGCVPCDLDGDALTCTVPPGQGQNVPIEVTVDGQRSPRWVGFSYDEVEITDVEPRSARAAGGVRLTIHGLNFGTQASVTVGGADCPIDEQTHDRIECTSPPGTGASAVQVTVAGRVSNDGSVLYGGPSSKCDATKAKIAGDFTKCLAGILAKNANKEQAEVDRTAAIAKCEAKLNKACDKAEAGTDCSQPGTCRALVVPCNRSINDMTGAIR